MRLDPLDGLMAFREVARSMSFTAAAARLEVSPQALSQAVRQLEARLGVRLFHRTTRSVSLTEAGERLWSELGPALDGIVDALEAVQASRDRPAGVLRVAVSRPAFSAVLQPLLADFHRAHPDIHCEFSFDDAFVDIAARGLDVGIRLGDSVAAEMVSVPVSRSETIAIVASPAYLKRRGVPRAIGDLVRHDCIRFRMPSAGTVYRWELLDDGKPVNVEVRGPVTVNDTAALLACAAEGLGLAYVIERTALAQLRDGTLRRVLAGAVPTLPGFHLYYASRRHVPPKLRCFVDFIAGRSAARRGAA